MRLSKLVVFLILISGPVFAADVITDFSNDSIVVLNEEFRKVNKKIRGFTGTCADGTALTVENGLIKSCS